MSSMHDIAPAMHIESTAACPYFTQAEHSDCSPQNPAVKCSLDMAPHKRRSTMPLFVLQDHRRHPGGATNRRCALRPIVEILATWRHLPSHLATYHRYSMRWQHNISKGKMQWISLNGLHTSGTGILPLVQSCVGSCFARRTIFGLSPIIRVHLIGDRPSGSAVTTSVIELVLRKCALQSRCYPSALLHRSSHACW